MSGQDGTWLLLADALTRVSELEGDLDAQTEQALSIGCRLHDAQRALREIAAYSDKPGFQKAADQRRMIAIARAALPQEKPNG